MVFGLRNGPLAIRRVHRKPGYLWKVDHLPSGLSISESIGLFESEGAARLVVELLLRLHQGWERQNWSLEGTDARELQRALGQRIKTSLEQAGLRGVPEDLPGARPGRAIWLNGYAPVQD